MLSELVVHDYFQEDSLVEVVVICVFHVSLLFTFIHDLVRTSVDTLAFFVVLYMCILQDSPKYALIEFADEHIAKRVLDMKTPVVMDERRLVVKPRSVKPKEASKPTAAVQKACASDGDNKMAVDQPLPRKTAMDQLLKLLTDASSVSLIFCDVPSA